MTPQQGNTLLLGVAAWCLLLKLPIDGQRVPVQTVSWDTQRRSNLSVISLAGKFTTEQGAFMQGKYRDRFGNMLPNSNQLQSENPTTFNVSYYFSSIYNGSVHVSLLADTSNLIYAKYRYNNNEWRTMEHDANPRWSIDEKVSALAFYSSLFQTTTYLIPVFPSFKNPSWASWLRPDVIAYTIGSKYTWTRWIMWHGIIKLKILGSIRDFLTNEKRPSSGVQLGFNMAMGWHKREFVEKHESTIREAMKIYYPQAGQPTRELWIGGGR